MPSEPSQSAALPIIARNRTPRRLWIFKLALLGFAVVMALVVGEVLVRMFVPVRNVGPAFTVYDPVYGKRIKPSYSCTRITPEFTMRFTTNSLGFRGPEPKEFPTGGILFVGDSFTMGYGVDDGQEFPAIIRKSLDERHGAGKIPVINAGVGGVGNGRWIKFLRDEAPRFKPRMVVFQMCENDFTDNTMERMYTLNDGGELVEQPIPPPGWKRRAQLVFEGIPGLSYSHLFALLRQERGTQSTAAPTTSPATAPAGPTPAEKLTFAILDECLQTCREQGYPVVVVTEMDDPRLDEVRRRVTQAGAQFVAVAPKSSRPDLYFRIDGHWTAAGHAHAAELLMPLVDTSEPDPRP